MHEIKITTEKLEELIKLDDWQLVKLGFDPQAITTAYLKFTDTN